MKDEDLEISEQARPKPQVCGLDTYIKYLSFPSFNLSCGFNYVDLAEDADSCVCLRHCRLRFQCIYLVCGITIYILYLLGR